LVNIIYKEGTQAGNCESVQLSDWGHCAGPTAARLCKRCPLCALLRSRVSLSLAHALTLFSLSLAMALSLQQQRSRRALLQLDNNLAARLLAAHLAAENRHRETHSVGLFVSTAATRRSLRFLRLCRRGGWGVDVWKGAATLNKPTNGQKSERGRARADFSDNVVIVIAILIYAQHTHS